MSKELFINPGTYRVVEIFKSIQGEGVHLGMPANFIRLAGCNLACEWCDTKDSWNADSAKLMVAEAIVAKLDKTIGLVVITGGEPLIYDLTPLIAEINREFNRNCLICIETNGTHRAPDGKNIWVTVSPKPQAAYAIETRPDEVKIVVDPAVNASILNNVEMRVSPKVPIFLQPESGRLTSVKKCVSLAMKSNRFRVGVQLHKIMGVK